MLYLVYLIQILTPSISLDVINFNRNQGVYVSPQLGPQGVPVSYVSAGRNSGGRTYSFDETTMLPPAAEQQDQVNPQYSPFGGSQGSNGGNVLQHQQHWGYGAPLDPYNAPASPLQPRATSHPPMPMYHPGGPMSTGLRPMAGGAPYGQFFPASSPGPPIQTTSSNKGPEGANLFIFHIPNHFTNIDMYQLFYPYGNLLSVRIMVEKDSGRSRGFGFVSYDSPESAALAIKELNGFAVRRYCIHSCFHNARNVSNNQSEQSNSHVYELPFLNFFLTDWQQAFESTA